MKTSMQRSSTSSPPGWPNSNDSVEPRGHHGQPRPVPQAHARTRRARSARREYALWRQALNDERTAQELLADPSMRDFAEEEIGEARERMETLDGDAAAMLLPKDPDDAQHLPRNPRGHGRRRVRAVRGRPVAHVPALCRAQPLAGRDDVGVPADLGGYKEVIVRDRPVRRRSARSVLAAQVRVRRPSRAARAGDRDARTHPHVRVHGRGDAGSRRNRRSRHQSGRFAHRHVPRVGRGRPAHQQDRFGRARHALADRHRRRMSGRPQAAQEQGAR